MSETCPTIFMFGDNIVEVAYTEWEETQPGEWVIAGTSGKIEINNMVNRIIFELPVGCFELETSILSGTVTIENNNTGAGLIQCTQKPQLANENKQTDTGFVAEYNYNIN